MERDKDDAQRVKIPKGERVKIPKRENTNSI